MLRSLEREYEVCFITALVLTGQVMRPKILPCSTSIFLHNVHISFYSSRETSTTQVNTLNFNQLHSKYLKTKLSHETNFCYLQTNLFLTASNSLSRNTDCTSISVSIDNTHNSLSNCVVKFTTNSKSLLLCTSKR